MIDSFRGAHAFLSNFHDSPVEYEGVEYPTVEHAYQAAKTLNGELRLNALGLTAGQVKRWGAKLPRRADWFGVSLGVMEELVREKFMRHPDLLEKLLATGEEELVEGNNWGDAFWGMVGGVGENHLGRILMKVRAELRNL